MVWLIAFEPENTFSKILSENQKQVSGFRVAKHRVSLFLSAKALGACKVKPVRIYRSENPRAVKGKTKIS